MSPCRKDMFQFITFTRNLWNAVRSASEAAFAIWHSVQRTGDVVRRGDFETFKVKVHSIIEGTLLESSKKIVGRGGKHNLLVLKQQCVNLLNKHMGF